MKKSIIVILIIICLFIISISMYAKFIYPPIPLIKEVGLVDNKIIVSFDVEIILIMMYIA